MMEAAGKVAHQPGVSTSSGLSRFPSCPNRPHLQTMSLHSFSEIKLSILARAIKNVTLQSKPRWPTWRKAAHCPLLDVSIKWWIYVNFPQSKRKRSPVGSTPLPFLRERLVCGNNLYLARRTFWLALVARQPRKEPRVFMRSRPGAKVIPATCADIKHHCKLTFHTDCNSAFLKIASKIA